MPKVSINNVSMDYFLRGVDAAKPKAAQPAQGPAPGNANEPVAQGALGVASKLVSQLDVLLLKAAKASTQSLDGKTVKQTFKKLVDDGALDRDSLKLLSKTADTAAKTLKALDKFTGRELADSFDAEGHFDATTKTGKAVAAAVKAQQDLSDLLAQLGKSLDALSRHDAQMREANPQYKGVDNDLFNKVNDLRQLCDRRAAEINHLTVQMRDFAVYLAGNGQNADPNVMAILKAKVNELLPRQALAMHGTADALATVSEEVSGKFRPLAEKIDAFRSNPSATVDSAEFTELQGDIVRMKAALQDIRANGVEVEGGHMMVAKDIVKALETEVAQAEALFQTAQTDVKRKVLDNYVETAVKLVCEDPAFENERSRGDDLFADLLIKRDEVIQGMQNLVAAALNPQTKLDDLSAQATNLWKKGVAMRKAAETVPRAPGPSGERFNLVVDRCQGICTALMALFDIVRRTRGNNHFFTGAEAMSVFNGTISASSIIEARARGLRDSDVDPANEDANIVSERTLGSGVAGTVHELHRIDGTSVVFKGETESRTGLLITAAGSGGSYEDNQQTININFATKKAAEALNMGGLVVNYSAGTHKGVFGFFMEKAKGFSAKAFGAGKSSSAPDAGMSAKEIKNLPARQRQQVKADIMRELNRLQWLDLVAGQNDRHWDNYFIHVDRETLKVTVKGIDNDAGYSQSRTGAVKYSFDKADSRLFKSQLLGLARTIDSRHAADEYAHLLQDPGIEVDAEGKITVDATKLENKAIGQVISVVTGTHSLAIPDQIDRETYDALIALKDGPKRQAYLNSIRPRLSDASYNAAVSRLDDVIAHAEKLGREGKIIEENGWLEVQAAPRESGKVAVRMRNGNEKRLGGEIAHDVHETLCPTYFARDGIAKILG